MHFVQYFTVFYSIMKRNLGTKQYILKIYIPKMQFLQKNVLLQILVVVSLYGLLALPLKQENEEEEQEDEEEQKKEEENPGKEIIVEESRGKTAIA